MSDIDAQEILSVEKKRRTIEKLVAYACQLKDVAQGLESAREILKPSQQPKRSQLKYLTKLIEKLEHFSVVELESTLAWLDVEVQKELGRILSISEISEQEFIAKFQSAQVAEGRTAYQALRDEIQVFKKHSQTNLAIRVCLHEQGVSLAAAHLPVSQERLASSLDALKVKETYCRRQIVSELDGMIKDIRRAMDKHQLPEDYKAHLKTLEVQLENDLIEIKSGGSLEAFADYIELVNLDCEDMDIRRCSDQALDEPIGLIPEIDESDTITEEDSIVMSQSKSDAWTKNNKATMGFWGKLARWFVSPWSVSWKMIANKSDKRSDE